jgi:hypothetical protein
MTYLTNYYKNRCETLQEQVNNLQKLLNEDDKKDKPEEDQLIMTTTFADQYTGMYGKEKFEKIIADIERRKKEDPAGLNAELDKMYAVGNYSKENISKPIEILVGRTKNDIANAETVQGKEKSQIVINNNPDMVDKNNNLVKRLPQQFLDKKIEATETGDNPSIGAHELHHTVQNNQVQFTNNPNDKWRNMPSDGYEAYMARHAAYRKSPQEITANMSSLKFADFKETGNYVGAYASDKEIEDFKSRLDKRIEIAKQKSPTGEAPTSMTGVRDALNTPVGVEAFRRQAKRNTDSSGTYA